jgi:biotin synthase
VHRQELIAWLQEQDAERLSSLWERADAVRRKVVGQAIHLRGLVEIGNHCQRCCLYCGLRKGRRGLRRYRMNEAEILACVHDAARRSYGTVVLQGGEDNHLSAPWMARVIRRIKAETALAVTLSLGERQPDELRRWRHAGADRYLLRFETSDPALYRRLHPPRHPEPIDRVALLRQLRDMGYEIGSGVIVGLPGQTIASLADDLQLMQRLDLDMIAIGPYIPHPDTPLGQCSTLAGIPPSASVPSSARMARKVLALARLLCPEANIPRTTALAVCATPEGDPLSLCAGANVIMPNVTPKRYRTLYDIYPGKGAGNVVSCLSPEAIAQELKAVHRRVGIGPGPRRRRSPIRPTQGLHDGLPV